MNSSFHTTSRNIIETVLLLLLLLVLLFALYDVLHVFFGIFTFALIFSVSFEHFFERLVRMLGNRRILAAIIYTILLLAIIALPFYYFIMAMSQHVKELTLWVIEARNNGLPPLPGWVSKIPFAGDQLAALWHDLQERPKETAALHQHQITNVLQSVLTKGAGMVGTTLEFMAGIIISAVMLVNRKKMLSPLHAAMNNLLGSRDGSKLIHITGQAIKGVSVGVMGTAFVAAIVSFIGFLIAGVPFALGLSALVFFLVVIQIGPLLVWVPLIIWLAVQGHTGLAVFAAIYAVVVLIIDSVLKPVLIARSGRLPFFVLFLGVIGGMVAWGFTGMFKGAIILAIFYKVFTSWLEKTKPTTEV